jgi:DNA-directed RNA polymerase specialized sigma24 family protein
MELRKSYWTRRAPLPAGEDPEHPSDEPTLVREVAGESENLDPARRAQQQQVHDILQRCLAGLPERNHLAIVSCIADDVRAERVAQTLNTTANAVYLLIARGKRQLKDCLQRAGLSSDVLSLFETA